MKQHPLEATRKNHLRGVAVLARGWDLPEGRERATRRLAEGLARDGVPVTYVTLAPARAGAAAPPPAHEVRGLVQVWRVPTGGATCPAATTDLLEAAALALLGWRRDRLDGIVAADPLCGAAAARLGRALGAPSLVRLPRGGPQGDVQAALRSPRRRAVVAGLRAATHIVAATPAIAREAADLLGVDPARALVVPDGVDLDAFSARPATPPRRRQVVLLGALEAWRRPELALDAFARVVQPDGGPARDDLELLVAGDGPERAALEARARPLGDRVRFLGPVEDASDALVTASALLAGHVPEGTPMALLEAMAMGVPVVAPREAPAAAVAQDGAEALLVAPGDAAALAAGLRRVLEEPALAATLKAGGKARATRDFDLARTVGRHVEVLERLKASRTDGGDGLQGPLGTLAATPLDRGALVRAGLDVGWRLGLDAVRAAGVRLGLR